MGALVGERGAWAAGAVFRPQSGVRADRDCVCAAGVGEARGLAAAVRAHERRDHGPPLLEHMVASMRARDVRRVEQNAGVCTGLAPWRLAVGVHAAVLLLRAIRDGPWARDVRPAGQPRTHDVGSLLVVLAMLCGERGGDHGGGYRYRLLWVDGGGESRDRVPWDRDGERTLAAGAGKTVGGGLVLGDFGDYGGSVLEAGNLCIEPAAILGVGAGFVVAWVARSRWCYDEIVQLREIRDRDDTTCVEERSKAFLKHCWLDQNQMLLLKANLMIESLEALSTSEANHAPFAISLH